MGDGKFFAPIIGCRYIYGRLSLVADNLVSTTSLVIDNFRCYFIKFWSPKMFFHAVHWAKTQIHKSKPRLTIGPRRRDKLPRAAMVARGKTWLEYKRRWRREQQTDVNSTTHKIKTHDDSNLILKNSVIANCNYSYLVLFFIIDYVIDLSWILLLKKLIK